MCNSPACPRASAGWATASAAGSRFGQRGRGRRTDFGAGRLHARPSRFRLGGDAASRDRKHEGWIGRDRRLADPQRAAQLFVGRRSRGDPWSRRTRVSAGLTIVADGAGRRRRSASSACSTAIPASACCATPTPATLGDRAGGAHRALRDAAERALIGDAPMQTRRQKQDRLIVGISGASGVVYGVRASAIVAQRRRRNASGDDPDGGADARLRDRAEGRRRARARQCVFTRSMTWRRRSRAARSSLPA